MAEPEDLSKRWRASVLAVTLLFALAVVASAFMPEGVTAERKRDRRPNISKDEKQDKIESFLANYEGSEVGAEIVGGKAVPQGKYDFMARIFFWTGASWVEGCGGSLIDQWYVLTAAHCVVDDGSVWDPDYLALVIGDATMDTFAEANVFYLWDVYVHGGYNEDTTANDVAILDLLWAVPASIAEPIDYVGSNDTRFNGVGQAVTAAGWGATSSGGNQSSRLLEAQVTVVSDSACTSAYGAAFSAFQSVMICAAYVGRDSCQGDSGGPLFAREVIGHKIKKKKGKKGKKPKKKKIPIYNYVQMGIVSWGYGCADPNYPGIYTRVSAPGINDFIVNNS